MIEGINLLERPINFITCNNNVSEAPTVVAQSNDSVSFSGDKKKKNPVPFALAALGGFGFFLGSKFGPFNRAKDNINFNDLAE